MGTQVAGAVAPGTDMAARSGAMSDPDARYARWWVVARVVATLGALLFVVAAWMPWALAVQHVGPATVAHLYLDPALTGAGPLADLLGPELAILTWSALTVLGALIVPLLWRRASSAWAWVPVVLYGAWAGVVTVVALASRPGLAGLDALRIFVPDGSDSIVARPGPAVERIEIAAGYWVAVVALTLTLAGFLLLFAAEAVRVHHVSADDVPVAARRSTRLAPGAAPLALALLVWTAGFLVFPWATVNCSATPLLGGGTCLGLGSTSAMRYALTTASAPPLYLDSAPALDPLVCYAAVLLLLGGGAALLLTGALTSRGPSRGLAVWATVWLVLIAAAAVIANAGVGVITRDPGSIGLPAGAWVGDSGILITFVALVLALIAVAALWVGVFRSRPAPAA